MNPYEVLGVSEDADEETIKKAYRELVKKYHPDKYVNNPLADLASEKIKEINKAYDEIMNKSKSSNSSYSSAGQRTYNNSGASSYQNVRKLIAMRQIDMALRMLNTLPKNAEWYYLSGCAYMQKGWYDQAMNNLRQAVNMDPDNVEYRSTLNNVQNRNTTYTNTTRGSSSGGFCVPCDCCTTCMCLNCICPC